MKGKHVLLLVAGGIAAYKSLELVRLLRKSGHRVTCVLTAAGARFVTPLSLQALSENRVYTDLWSLTDESEMGHIQLSRAADLIVVAPATADILARMAAGIADDLATTLLLATDTRVLVAPAMNVRMWTHPATVENMARLQARGVAMVGPEEGEMACHEVGPGRLADPAAIEAAIAAMLGEGALTGRHAIVTSGPTHEPIDPVRYIANHSSGRQGHAIAAALATAGARVTLVHGPVQLGAPPGVQAIPVTTAEQMRAACEAALPADIFVGVAAVGDWRVAHASGQKLKKQPGAAPTLALAENPDILASIAAAGPHRPCLVIGFAAETETVLNHAQAKWRRKGCDWLLANDVSPDSGIMGGHHTQVSLISAQGVEHWPAASKQDVAERLVARIAAHFGAA